MFYCLDSVFYGDQPAYDYFPAQDPSQTRPRVVLDTTVTNQAVSGLSYLAQIFNIPEAVEIQPINAISLINDSPLEREIVEIYDSPSEGEVLEISDSEEYERPDHELTEAVEEKDSLHKEITTTFGDDEEHSVGPYCRICGDEKEISSTKGPQGGDLCVVHANAYKFDICYEGQEKADELYADRLTQHPRTLKNVDRTDLLKQIDPVRFCGICGIPNQKGMYNGPGGSKLCRKHGQSYRKWYHLAEENSLDPSIIQKVFSARYLGPSLLANASAQKLDSPNEILKNLFPNL